MELDNELPASEIEGSLEGVDNAPEAKVTTETPQEQTPVIPEVPAYQANFKFKVKDSEHEIPEQFRAVIKDPETEKLAKEIFEKAYGLDHVKTERSQVKEEYKTYRSKTEPILKIAQELEYYRQKGDMGSYFQTLGLTKQQIYNWALKQAELEELSPDQKRVYDEREEANRQLYLREQQFQEMQANLQNLQVQQRSAELNMALSKPDVSSYVQAFDQRNGQDAFKEEVISRGQMYWSLYGKDVPAEQLVQEIMQKFGAGQAPVASVAGPQAAPRTTPQPPRQVPVIPNTGTGTSSPAARAVRSVEDVERLYQEKFGAR